METLVIDRHDIRQLVDHVGLDVLMREMISRLKTSLASIHGGEIKAPTRSGFSYHRPRLGLVEWMPAMRKEGPVCVKMVGYHPSNPSTLNLPTILSTVSLYDTRNGHLLGLADATFLTALRTGAASAVASRWLAKPEVQVLGLVGAGAQAVTQAHAICLELPSIKEVLFYDTDEAVMATYLDRMEALNLPVILRAATLEEIVSQADILSTATSVDVGGGPVFPGGGEKPWLHVNAVGSDFPGKTEVPIDLLRRAFVCPDFKEQATVEGECQQLRPDEIDTDLALIAENPEAVAKYQNELTVFDSTGWAVEDLSAMEMLLDYAKEFQLGQPIELESISDDPMNPYKLVEATSSPIAHVSF